MLALPVQRSPTLVSGREGPNTGSSVAGDDVHELHLRLQPHSSQTPLPQLRTGESRRKHKHRAPLATRLLDTHGVVCAEIICYLTQIVCRSCSRNRYPLKYMKDRMAKVCDHCYNELRKRGELCFHSMSAATPLCRPSSGLCSYVYVADAPALSSQSSPRPHRSSRPLSAVFQNIHPPNIWRHRKGIVTFTQVCVQQQKMAAGEDGSRLRRPLLLPQVTVSEEGSISGSLQRSKKSKRSWKRLWFLLKDKVLYTYRAQEVRPNEHAVAMQTKPDLQLPVFFFLQEKVASETLPLLGFTVKPPDRQPSEEEEASIFRLYHKSTLYYTFKAADIHTAQR